MSRVFAPVENSCRRASSYVDELHDNEQHITSICSKDAMAAESFVKLKWKKNGNFVNFLKKRIFVMFN